MDNKELKPLNAAQFKDAVFQASIDFIGTLTGMKPPPIEVAPPEVFAPFNKFTEEVVALQLRLSATTPPASGDLEAERKDFEAHLVDRFPSDTSFLYRRDMPGSVHFGEYVNEKVQRYWLGWKDRAAISPSAQPQPPSDVEIDDIKIHLKESIRLSKPGDHYVQPACLVWKYWLEKYLSLIEKLASAQPQQEPFQMRVQPWMMECFGAEISADVEERNHRFFEEAGEYVQACGMSASEAHQLVDYVWGRPIGEKHQEVGGVMVTLAASCLAQGLDMHQCGETELARIWTKVEKIRAKQAAKPKHSPLPEAPQPQIAPEAIGCPTIDLSRVGIEQIYKTYEDRFGPLPVELMGNEIEWEIKEMIKNYRDPEAIVRAALEWAGLSPGIAPADVAAILTKAGE